MNEPIWARIVSRAPPAGYSVLLPAMLGPVMSWMKGEGGGEAEGGRLRAEGSEGAAGAAMLRVRARRRGCVAGAKGPRGTPRRMSFGTKRAALQDLVENRVAALADVEDRLIHDAGPDVPLLDRKGRERNQDVDLGQRLGGLLEPAALRRSPGPAAG